jgi:CMP-N-acetylneuraminic acid synthetase
MPNEDLGRVLGLIPARGGSKGIPRKNIVPLAGRPLLAWTLEAARESGVLDRILVSTEDAEIAEVARRLGAELPFLRPAHLSRDDTPGLDPVLHAVETLAQGGYSPGWVMLLQPTSPLRTADDIRGILALRARPGANSVISICEAAHPPAWLRRVSGEGLLEPYFPKEEIPATRQELGRTYALNGAIYLVRTEALIRTRSLTPDRTYAFIMGRENSIDIDTPWDLKVADLLLRDRRGPRA